MASIDKLRTDPPDKSSGKPQNTTAPSLGLPATPQDDHARLSLKNGNPRYRRQQQQQQRQLQQQQRSSLQRDDAQHNHDVDLVTVSNFASKTQQRDGSVGVDGGGGGGEGEERGRGGGGSDSNPHILNSPLPFSEGATYQQYSQRLPPATQGSCTPTQKTLSVSPYHTARPPSRSPSPSPQSSSSSSNLGPRGGKPSSSPSNHLYVVDHKTSGGNDSCCPYGEGRESAGIKQAPRLEKQISDDIFTADDDKAVVSCFTPSLKGLVGPGRDCFSSPRTSSPRFAKYRRQQRVRTPSDDVAIIDIESHDDASDDTVVNASCGKKSSSSSSSSVHRDKHNKHSKNNNGKSNTNSRHGENQAITNNANNDVEKDRPHKHGSSMFFIGSEDSERTDVSLETSSRRRSLNETCVLDTTTSSSQGHTEDLDTTRGSDDLTIADSDRCADNETSARSAVNESASRATTPSPKGDKSKRRKLYQRRANTTTSSKRHIGGGLFGQGRGAAADRSSKGQNHDSPAEDNVSGGSGSSKPPRRIAKRGIGMFPSSNWRRLRNTLKAANEMQAQKKPKHLLTREDSFLRKFSTRNHQSQNANNLTDEESPRAEQPEVKIGSKFVIQHDGNFMFYWLGVVTMSVMYNLWTCIARQAFTEIQTDCPTCWFSFDALFDFIYIADIIVQFRTGYLDQGLVVYDSRKLRDRYIKSRGVYIDVVCLVPLDLLQLYIGIHPMIRFPRFLKIYRAFRFLHMLESRTQYPNLIRVASLTHILFLGAHWFAAFYYMISEAEGFTGGWSYPEPTGINADVKRKYLKSLYWSTLTLTTIGDLPQPENANEYVFVIVSYLIGVFVFATIVGQVGNVINNRNASRQEFERLLDGAKIYMQTHNVPHNLQKRVQRWYDYVWSRGRLNGCDINSLGLLPDKLKTELAIHVNLETLKKVTIFQECQPEFLHDLVLKMKAYIFTPGDLICRRGEVAREMFIIADGVVEIISETGVMLKRMGAGDFFGEIGILNLDGGINRRSADVRSVGYLELFVLSREDVLGALKDHPEAESIIRDYGQRRLREMEAHRQKVKPVKCQDSSDDQSLSSTTVQNRLLKTLRSLSPAVRRQSAQMHVRSASTQSGYQNPGSPGPNQKPGIASLRCVVPSQHCNQGPVSAGVDGLFKSSFQVTATTDSSEDTSGESQHNRHYHKHHNNQSKSRHRSGYIGSIYNRISGFFRRKVGERKRLGMYDSHSHGSHYSPSKESYSKGNNSSPQSSPLHCSRGRKCSVTVNVESCSDNESNSDDDEDDIPELTDDKKCSNVHLDGDGHVKEVQSGLDGDSFLISNNADGPPVTHGFGSKLVQVFQEKLKSSSHSYAPVRSDDLDEKFDNMCPKFKMESNDVLHDNCPSINPDSERNIEGIGIREVIGKTRSNVVKEMDDGRQRTRSFTGDRCSKSAFHARRARALELASVRFSLDSCDSPTGSSIRLGEKELPSDWHEALAESRALCDNVCVDHRHGDTATGPPFCTGQKETAKAMPSLSLASSNSCPTRSHPVSPSSPIQTFSNPDVSFISAGTELAIRSGNSDSCVRETFPNIPKKVLYKPSPIPPLVPPSAKGCVLGCSRDGNYFDFPALENVQNPNGVVMSNVVNRQKKVHNRFHGHSRLAGNAGVANSSDLHKNGTCNSIRCYSAINKEDCSSVYFMNCGNTNSNNSNNNNNNNNNNDNDGFSDKCPAGTSQDRVFVSRSSSHRGCHCDPAENFHQIMSKHWPEGFQHRGKRVNREVPSASHWYQNGRPDMTSPEGTGSKLNTGRSCAGVRRSLSLPSIIDAFTAMTSSSHRGGTLSSRRCSTQDDTCWSADDARRLDPKFILKSRFSEESVSCRSMDRDGSGKWGRSKAMSIIQTPASDMAYQQLSEQIHLMRDLLDKRLALLEEANASSSIKLDRLANSHETLMRMFRQQIPRQDSSSSRAPLLSAEDDGLPASCV